MDRRIALKNLALILGGAIAFPAGLKAGENASFALKNITLTATEQTLLADIAETIIPETDTPGAKTLGLPQFVMLMVDDCQPVAEQQKFSAGIKAFPAFAEAQMQKSFAACLPDERIALLMKLENGEGNPPAEVLNFYRTVKRYTVFGYTNSKFFMTKQIPYRLVPGKYNPALKLSLAAHG